MTSRQFYIPDGEFDVSRIVKHVRCILEDSLDRGFEGLYISSYASKVFDYMKNNGMT